MGSGRGSVSLSQLCASMRPIRSKTALRFGSARRSSFPAIASCLARTPTRSASSTVARSVRGSPLKPGFGRSSLPGSKDRPCGEGREEAVGHGNGDRS
jgi:hypothetical protein